MVGDYVAEFGQGLALWRAAGFGKGRESVRPLVKRGRGLRPYGSTDENQFFRGVAATVAVTPALYVTALASRRTLDASFNDIDTTDVEVPITDATVAGLAADGLHRTPSELAKKDALGETLFGGGAEVRFERATVGVVGYSARFDSPLAPGDRPYERFDFAGDAATVGSAYANVFLGTFQLFGEVASSDGVLAGIGGAEASLDRLDAVVLVRHYPRDFASLHGYAFGERNGVTQNETGLYLGLGLRPAKRWRVSGYVDQYRFPWVRFSLPRPATGHEALLYVEYQPRRWITLYAQGRTETRETAADFAQPTGAGPPWPRVGDAPEPPPPGRIRGQPRPPLPHPPRRLALPRGRCPRLDRRAPLPGRPVAAHAVAPARHAPHVLRHRGLRREALPVRERPDGRLREYAPLRGAARGPMPS